ncbi:MAG TPA: peptidylprolyl isomerase [Candidatus Udaeobacter sp.]|nr:peptidylprolyl isomerase [Candidatus Udaeobacter sp.]
MKKLLLFIFPAIIILTGAGCSQTQQNQPANKTTNTQTSDNPNIIIESPAVSPTSTTSTATKPIKNISKLNMDLSTYTSPIMIIDQKKTYTAKMKTTAGEIDIALNAAATPVTANNFVFLAKKKFYDNVIFHRVIKGFMIQSGDPTGRGNGGPGYQFDDETFTGEYTRGTVAMANYGPNTNGSQFFIMHEDNTLQPNYVIFGKVTKGLDVVDKIAAAPVTDNGMGETSKPVTPIKILSIDIIEK